MNIDNFYDDIDKKNFYLGLVSQVFRNSSYIQVENLSLLSSRKIWKKILVPNTINYYVVIESTQGIFMGEIYQSKIQSTDSVHDAMNLDRKEKVFPELAVNIIGVMKNDEDFEPSGYLTVGIGNKVYIANDRTINMYLKSLEINRYSKTNDLGQKVNQDKISDIAFLSNFNNRNFSIQPNTLFDHHLMMIGTTNSGKSTSSLKILENLVKTNRKILLIDPTGEYKDSFNENEVEKLTLGIDTIIPVGELSAQEWELLFQTNDNTQGATLSDAIKSLRYQAKFGLNDEVYRKNGKIVQVVHEQMEKVTLSDKKFNLELLASQINQESVEINKSNKYFFQNFKENVNAWLVQKVKYELDNTKILNFFGNEGTNLLDKLDEFMSAEGTSLYIDASNIGTNDEIGAMIVDLISNYVVENDQNKIKPFVMFIDEVHRYMKFNQNNDDRYISGLTTIAREGRKKGEFLFLTTQSPKDVPEILLSQIGTLIIHRLTNSDELRIIQNYLDDNTLKQIRKLGQGEAILTSVNLLQDIYLKFKKSYRNHNNKTPVL